MMSGDSGLGDAAASLRSAIKEALAGLVDREVLGELIALSAVAGEHVLVVGPPGTAKSEVVRRVASALGARYFEYLLGRFTEPSELFGPIDLRRLREGVVETETNGMLPEAEVAFLDEIFLGSTAILNTLLGILNERLFRRGHRAQACPLRVCVGATNVVPDDESLAAFADRFLVQVFVQPIPDAQLEELLSAGWSLRPRIQTSIALAALDRLTDAARAADFSSLRPHLAHALRLLRASGITLTDRRAVKSQRLIAAAALLAGRNRPTEADLWPLVYAVPSAEGQRVARDVLRELLATTENETLAAAALEASLGPRARATRIAAMGRALLGERPADDEVSLRAWRLKLEGVAREIDAGFAPELLPDDLRNVRADVLAALRPSG
jgi:MoxR-like ATPase